MRLNVTMLRDSLKCPQLAHYLHVQRRGPLHTPTALEVGTLFHEAMELRMIGAGIIGFEVPSWTEVSQDARDVWNKHKLWIPINAFAPDPNWEIHGIEMKVQRAINQNLVLEGTLDGFVIWQGKLWDLQWKTYTDNLLDLIEKVRLSWHEVAYQWMAEGMRSDLPWGGTILGACQKLPGYRMVPGDDGKKHKEEVTDAQRAAAFTLHFITRGRAQQDSMTAHLFMMAMRAQSDLQLSTFVPRNFDQCFGKFGGRCPFFDVCHNGADLAGPEFKDQEDRYAVRHGEQI